MNDWSFEKYKRYFCIEFEYKVQYNFGILVGMISCTVRTKVRFHLVILHDICII